MSRLRQRRDFLKAASTGTAAVLLGQETARPAARALHKAIMYATIGLKGTVLEKFQAVKAAGFEGVEPMSHMKQQEVLAALEATGLKAASVCCDTHWAKPLSDPDEKVRREGLEGLQQALKDAKAYGATSVLLVPADARKGGSYDECFHRSVAEIRKAVPLAKELGVKIAVENVWNEFITKPDQAVAFLDAIDSPMVGWHFDIGNAIRYGLPEEWIPILGKRILKLHIKEYSALKKFNVALLEGDNHWPAIMKALDQVGYQGWGISEQPRQQARDVDSMRQLSERMDRVFAS
jgi:L-ribulose-5-phosphate 3-epimerase